MFSCLLIITIFCRTQGAQHQQQHRAQVNRQKCPELFGGLTYGAEEGPTGAVHRQRQAIDPRANPRRQRFAAPVTIKGNGEHNGHIGQGNGGNQPAGQRHGHSGHKNAQAFQARDDSLA
jgi:hypothetical protein